jgi:hypothetical protein
MDVANPEIQSFSPIQAALSISLTLRSDRVMDYKVAKSEPTNANVEKIYPVFELRLDAMSDDIASMGCLDELLSSLVRARWYNAGD